MVSRKQQKDEDKKNSAIKKFSASVTLSHLKDETRRMIGAIFLFALFLIFSLAGFHKAGFVGDEFYKFFSYLVGIGYFLIPLLLLLLSISLGSENKDEERKGHRTIGGLLFFLSGITLLDLVYGSGSGVIGEAIGKTLVRAFDFYGSVIIATAIFLTSILILFELPLGINAGLDFFKNWFSRFRKNEPGVNAELSEKEASLINNSIPGLPEEKELLAKNTQGEKWSEGDNTSSSSYQEFEPEERAKKYLKPLFTLNLEKFDLPSISLLEGDRGRPGVGDIKANANIIKRTLANFGIIVEMDEISIGPSVTRYALKPAEGVRLQRIVALQQNLELALAAHPVRIEAPIPGKSLVGIEVPNTTKSIVGLGAMLGSLEFQNSDKPLYVALGRGISGESFFANMAKMPHLLVAGATGSGKSVMIHNLITSLLYRNSPEHLRLIMVDPKRVELTLYNKIPHLLHPVITDAKKAILALRWAAKEMERRYDILESESVRDIDSYHRNVLAPSIENIRKQSGNSENISLPETMPYIVIVIDELADIMQSYPRELEAAIVRLAQMSRAVGIHLILSTQRPSVNVITGLIKANIPARIAMQVASQIDSRTILDMSGAEKLLGSGDMLYLSADMAQPQRMQSPFITENELKKVVNHLIKAGEHIPPSEINLAGNNSPEGANSMFSNNVEDVAEDVDDSVYEEAREAVIKAGKASTSYLQRRLRIGYSRAARIMDLLEERGVIGPQDGAKPREVLVKGSEVSEETGENMI